ncbi:MAG: hypothetical protein COB02_14050 [Candidatus Cloacimonadota bacterium]|nr:MAG: hypothetical protein COB02_14050 [Candidatus Cloacimonadota bacterium]
MKELTTKLASIQNKLNSHLKFNLALQFDNSVHQSLDFLNSKKTHDNIMLNPYWPKWDGAWWHILALIEIGQYSLIPDKSIQLIQKSIHKNNLQYFPLTESELPKNIDPYRNIICHCQLGTYIKILILTQKDFILPEWIKNWFIKYQIQDGGYNCDDESYHKKHPKSSLVSTLPMLESLLILLQDTESFQDIKKNQMLKLLDKGAHYFLDRNLVCKSNSNTVINENWLKLGFPRFYELDSLRILSFLNKWANYRDILLPIDKISLVLESLCNQIEKDGTLKSGFHMTTVDNKSLIHQKDNTWKYLDATSFPLLDTLECPKVAANFLNREFLEFIQTFKFKS